MINGEFLDVRKQRVVLDAILSSNRRRFPEKKDAFKKENYFITTSDGEMSEFNGKYSRKEDTISIDKMFIYDMLCSNSVYDIRNTVIHEEAHRQVFLNSREDKLADHWENWLTEYLSMGGKPPEVYVKITFYERNMCYREIKDEDLKNIIIITDDGKEASKKLITKRSAIKSPFLVVDEYKNIKKNNFRY